MFGWFSYPNGCGLFCWRGVAIAGVRFNGNMILALSFHRRVGGNLYTPLKNDGVRQLG